MNALTRRRGRAASLLALIVAWEGAAQNSYPRLGSLGPDDLIYRQHQEAVAAAYAAESSGRLGEDLSLFLYIPGSTVDIFSLAARLSLPYETLASLNRLDRAREILPGERLLVPSAPGLFVSTRPKTDLEYLLSYRDGEDGISLHAGGAPFVYFPGARFTPEERALFLGRLFRFPLPAGRLTSGFGQRTSPITGRASVHAGVDLAAPLGTEVYAVREGRITASGIDPSLGEFITIEHDGGWTTVYGHLSQRYAQLNETVESGMLIGRVGSTGLSTGPHLHFEVRVRGEARNPEAYIPKGRR